MQLQTWTKQSLREKPFATTKGKIWTSSPNYIPLENIYTSLSLINKKRGTASLMKTPLSDITQLFNEEILQRSPSDCTRIMVTGKLLCFVLHTKLMDVILHAEKDRTAHPSLVELMNILAL